MRTIKNAQQIIKQENEYKFQATCNRRLFVKGGIVATITAAMGTNFLFSACGGKEGEKEVSPPEDLMQEHGLLNRVLLIYDHCKEQLFQKQSCDPEQIHQAAEIIHSFIEDYHEKQEEDYLFPRFEKAGVLTELVATLRVQHQAGRQITGQIMQMTGSGKLNENENQKLIMLLSQFNRMYRPHEAREDTVLFPAFRKIVSRHEYDALGEDFEKNEEKHFGKNGYEATVARVAGIEKVLGIYDLNLFTPG